jgi:hypothetical protein
MAHTHAGSSSQAQDGTGQGKALRWQKFRVGEPDSQSGSNITTKGKRKEVFGRNKTRKIEAKKKLNLIKERLKMENNNNDCQDLDHIYYLFDRVGDHTTEWIHDLHELMKDYQVKGEAARQSSANLWVKTSQALQEGKNYSDLREAAQKQQVIMEENFAFSVVLKELLDSADELKNHLDYAIEKGFT